MHKNIGYILLAGLLAGTAFAAEPPDGLKTFRPEGKPWTTYRFAPDATMEIDLASDTAWTLSLDGGPVRPIKVPAGGWNSDQQEPQIPVAKTKGNIGYKCVVYERQLAVPVEARDHTIKILFGSCNYVAEVYLDDKQIAKHTSLMTPFEADLTGAAKPGETHRLRVKTYPHGPGPQGFANAGVTNTKFARGLAGHVRLVVLPAVYISDVFVRPSVAKKSLSCDIWVSNSSAVAHQVKLSTTLTSWNKKEWKYPEAPVREIEVPAGQTVKVGWADVPWTLGPDSYWWPNIPFRENYVATLHWLNLSLSENGKPLAQRRQRFGFAEHAEGPFYYTINGIRYTGFGDCISYGQVGEYDCWTETACFQPPHGNVKGCPETWRRYQRIGFNSMRLSTSVPTKYMLETADEGGYLLIPEGGSWASGSGIRHIEPHALQLREMIQVVRNHPCVARYSLSNESFGQDIPPDGPAPGRWLIDAALDVDDTRPLVFEVRPSVGTGIVHGMKRGHAYRMAHYNHIVPGGDYIRGLGETLWTTDGIKGTAAVGLKMRLNDWAYFSPWSWVNYWPNFLEGMNHERHPWPMNNHADRTDEVDGWGSPAVKFVQQALHPYLVIDRELLEARGDDKNAANVTWPREVPKYLAGESVKRQIEVCNGALSGRQLELRWQARWDTAKGDLFREGRIQPIEIEPGFHATSVVQFDLPPTVERSRTLYLVLESFKDGESVYRQDRIRFQIGPVTTR